MCVNNGTLHIADRSGDGLSCSYCDCEDGWEGVDCGRCSSVSACPAVTINGTVRGRTYGRSLAGSVWGCPPCLNTPRLFGTAVVSILLLYIRRNPAQVDSSFFVLFCFCLVAFMFPLRLPL